MRALVAIEAHSREFPEEFVAPVVVADVMTVDRARFLQPSQIPPERLKTASRFASHSGVRRYSLCCSSHSARSASRCS